MSSFSQQVKTSYHKWTMRRKRRVTLYRLLQRLTLLSVRRRGYARVVFFASSLSMWRYQRLYERLASDKRFRLTIVIAPFPTYTPQAQRQSAEELRAFFDQRAMSYVMLDDLPHPQRVKALKPDVLFYVQPYRLFGKNVDFASFRHRLIAYYPYGLLNTAKEWNYNLKFHNVAWRYYLATSLHAATSRDFSAVGDSNVVVVGEPHADDFAAPVTCDPWREPAGGRKRVIWAPHFQIVPNVVFYRPSFLWTHELMLDIARRYSDRLFIAFKPHPRLFSALCEHPDWGEERARDYYDAWRALPNAQVEDGEFVELFKTSDALIHDCGSFTAEYQYTRRPCMFLSREVDTVRQEFCRFGAKCFDNHYHGASPADVVRFIDDVVLGEGHDEKAAVREAFFADYLQPPGGRSTAENTYRDMVAALFGEH